MSDKKILLSGVKPTGRPHVGNYFGAMKQFVDLQDEYESYIMIADYHALINIQDPKEMHENILGVMMDYLAIGLDPKKVVLFKQSDVSEHTELTWIFNCITTVPYLMRSHAYKDAQAKNKEVNVGLFGYPMLMATDILMYDPDIVPVGQDQKQHVEYARDTAEKFNRIFGETFKLPKELIIESVGAVPGVDGRKMSKSYGNTIPLFAEAEDIKKAVMSIPTDSKEVNERKDPDTSNLFALHKLFSKDKLIELRERYVKGDIGYKESKEILIGDISTLITPLREKRKMLQNDTEKVIEILKEGNKKAKAKAVLKMNEVRKKIGVNL
jgi:tryptophanyl-tRNA synthetase